MKTVIFDFDGTIADSFDFVLDFLIEAAGHEPITDSGIRDDYRQLSMLGMARRLGISWFKLPFLLMRGRQEMARRMQHVKPFPEMVELLRELHKSNYQLLIVSTNAAQTIELFLRQNQLADYFDKIVGSISVFGKAPALRRIVKNFQLRLTDVVYIGDEVRDIEASKAAGIDCISVSWGFANTRFLEAAKPFALVHTPAELKRVITHTKHL